MYFTLIPLSSSESIEGISSCAATETTELAPESLLGAFFLTRLLVASTPSKVLLEDGRARALRVNVGGDFFLYPSSLHNAFASSDLVFRTPRFDGSLDGEAFLFSVGDPTRCSSGDRGLRGDLDELVLRWRLGPTLRRLAGVWHAS